MEEAIRQRIIFLLKERGKTIYSISENKSNQRKLNRQINEGTSISCETISSILSIFDDLSAEWLLRGKGPMFNEASVGNIISGNKGFSNFGDAGGHIVSIEGSGYEKVIDEDRVEVMRNTNSNVNDLNEIDRLNHEIDYLEKIISDKNEIIKSKEEAISVYRELMSCIKR